MCDTSPKERGEGVIGKLQTCLSATSRCKMKVFEAVVHTQLHDNIETNPCMISYMQHSQVSSPSTVPSDQVMTGGEHWTKMKSLVPS